MADYIGLRIARWRATAGMTQQQLADRVSVFAADITRIEGGKRAVTKRSLIIARATALGVRVEDLTAQPAQPLDASELAITVPHLGSGGHWTRTRTGRRRESTMSPAKLKKRYARGWPVTTWRTRRCCLT